MSEGSGLILVTDFDGTITAEDFYTLVVERLLQPEDLLPWNDYRAGRITHFTALQRIFSRIRAPEETVLALLRDMKPDPDLSAAALALKRSGWHVVVASAGCAWYISRILDSLGLDFEVHANPGTYQPGGPLCMEAPVGSPFYDPETGIDKAGIVRFYLQQGAKVAYAGDGYTDVDAGLLVSPERRFARADMAASLRKKGASFRPFDVWSDMVRALLEKTDI